MADADVELVPSWMVWVFDTDGVGADIISGELGGVEIECDCGRVFKTEYW
jgi:hypothetical protein